MRNLTFNFGNEANIITCLEHDDKTITIPAITNSPVFNSMEELAQNYAQARGVKPENFKSWVLLEDNTCYTYVLRAGTAGVRASEITDAITQAFDELRAEPDASPLSIGSVASILQESRDVEGTLTEMNLNYPHLQATITAVYQKLTDAGCFVEEVVETDNRSAFEKFVDAEMENRGSLSVIAYALHLPIAATKETILATLGEDTPQAVERFSIVYRTTVEALSVYNTTIDKALCIVTQEPIGAVDMNAKFNLITAAQLASRTSVNVPVCRVGHTGVIMSAEYLSIDEINAQDMYKIDDCATIIRFDDTVDAELVERRAEHIAEREEAYGHFYGYVEDGYDEDGYDKDGYNEDGYDKDGYDEDGYDKDGYNKDEDVD